MIITSKSKNIKIYIIKTERNYFLKNYKTVVTAIICENKLNQLKENYDVYMTG